MCERNIVYNVLSNVYTLIHMKKILMVIGARPNYMKAYPLYLKLKNDYNITLIHTGQHIDTSMNKIFLDQFKMCDVHKQYNLLGGKNRIGIYENILYSGDTTIDYLCGVSSKLINTNPNELGQVGEIVKYLLTDIAELKPDYLMVFGDVTSTLAGALASKISNTKLIHVEAGLRSFDMDMPEEVNRIITDHISDILLVTQKSGYENLKREQPKGNIYNINNPMIECLKIFEEQMRDMNTYMKYNLKRKKYIVATLHRPNNVDNLYELNKICQELNTLGCNYDIIFPVHPRTKKNIEKLEKEYNNIKLIEPLDYISFMSLIVDSFAVITDSGGIQEETTYLGIPCYTYRKNTERPDTLVQNGGTNRLIDNISINMFD